MNQLVRVKIAGQQLKSKIEINCRISTIIQDSLVVVSICRLLALAILIYGIIIMIMIIMIMFLTASILL